MGHFVFRIDQLKIFNNREIGRAEIRILSFVTTDNASSLPNLSELYSTTNQAKKREMVKRAAEEVAANRVFTQIDNVRDNHKFFFGDTGFALYRSDQIPNQLHWSLLVNEDDKKMNRAGDYVNRLIGSDKFDQQVGQLIENLAAATPQVVLYSKIAILVTRGVASLMKENHDDQVGVLYQSFDKERHYPHGFRSRNKVRDLTGNMLIDYTMFGMK